MSGHPVWFILIGLVLVWYGALTAYVGWRGYGEIHALLGDLRRQRLTGGEPKPGVDTPEQ